MSTLPPSPRHARRPHLAARGRIGSLWLASALAATSLAASCGGDAPQGAPSSEGAAGGGGAAGGAGQQPVAVGVGRCDYGNPFTGQPECKQYLGAGWSAADAGADCAAIDAKGGTFVAGGACNIDPSIGQCVVDKGDGLAHTIYLGGTDPKTCTGGAGACKAFAGGTFVPTQTCANPVGDDHTVFVWPTRTCADPVAGEPAGASDGKVCTWNLISGCTEEGRDYRDYGSCSDVMTNRPYYPGEGRPVGGADDPRRGDAAFVAESTWAQAQTRACACICCHDDKAPKGPSKWAVTDDPLWVDSISDRGIAMFAGHVDSSALGAFEPGDNNGFDRTHTAMPSTDPKRMVAFFQAEFLRRGLTEAWASTIAPIGQALLDQVNYQPPPCEKGDGLDAAGKLTWKDKQRARYVYVLDVGGKNPGIPPNFDLPASTRWRIDVAATDAPLDRGISYGVTPPGAQQRFPVTGSPEPLVSGSSYVLYVLYDVALPIARCVFQAP